MNSKSNKNTSTEMKCEFDGECKIFQGSTLNGQILNQCCLGNTNAALQQCRNQPLGSNSHRHAIVQ